MNMPDSNQGKITILYRDGTSRPFAVEELQAKLLQAFITAGLDEGYLAEDMALAVELSLIDSERPEKVFAETEINAVVFKILEDSGRPEAAACFRDANPCVSVEVNSEERILHDLLQRYLNLPELQTSAVCAKVLAAAKQLKITSAPPSLYLELGKYYKDKQFHAASPLKVRSRNTTGVSRKASRRGSALVLTPDHIVSAQTPEIRQWFEDGIFRVGGVGELFPTLHLTFMMHPYVEKCGLALPVSEMLLLPELDHAAQVARGICRAVNLLYLATGRGGENLPVCFTVPDMSRFAWEQLQGAWPGSRGVCMELLGPFKTALNDFQLKVKVC